jgi:hypothetical protein
VLYCTQWQELVERLKVGRSSTGFDHDVPSTWPARRPLIESNRFFRQDRQVWMNAVQGVWYVLPNCVAVPGRIDVRSKEVAHWRVV